VIEFTTNIMSGFRYTIITYPIGMVVLVGLNVNMRGTVRLALATMSMTVTPQAVDRRRIQGSYIVCGYTILGIID
jgi:hypothetical protein